MPQSRLTGSRIRERRLFIGQKQAALAKSVGISAAYLNLIEHNRRRIGGKLLHDIARELDTDPMSLTEGAEAALLGALREAGRRLPETEPELRRTEDLAGRFPGWSALVAAQHNRIRDLEQLVEALSDRLTHDPELAASLHEVISAVTAIRSTVGILSEGGDLDPEWQTRFLRNLREEGRRLSGSAQGLVEYLDAGASREMAPVAPGEELSVFMEDRGHHFPELEDQPDRLAPAGAVDKRVEALVAQVPGLETQESQHASRRHFQRYAKEASLMPMKAIQSAREELGWDAAAIAARFEQSIASVMRRLAFVPTADGAAGAGLVSCDGSGALVLRKPIRGFVVPRFGAACAYWPLYHALTRPGVPIRALVEQPGPSFRRYYCQAICLPNDLPRYDRPPVLEAVMLVLPAEEVPEATVSQLGAPLPVGSSCRVCPRTDCDARREATLLTG